MSVNAVSVYMRYYAYIASSITLSTFNPLSNTSKHAIPILGIQI